MISKEIIRSVPKVLLHDHLDGGLRPETIAELAEEYDYKELPSSDPEELGDWFHRLADRGNLADYLKGFSHTCALMQTKAALERVAYEMMEDIWKDGICYVETRFAPVYHVKGNLHLDDVVRAVLKGLERGKKDFGVGFGLILCGMRNMTDTLEIAELALDFRDWGVVGFDLAGEEGGYPPKKHIDAFHFIQRANFNITIHAGESFGKESIWQAIQWCGAHRIGHATHLKEDMLVDEAGKITRFGDLAQYILDKRIPLEICLSSNLHTGAIDKVENHPFGNLFREKFRVTLNTDDRLMSNTTLSKEFMIAAKYFDLSLDDIEKITINSMKSSFIHYDQRLKYIYEVIKPGFREAKSKLQTEYPDDKL